jgi:6-phosphogluconate dehydrogenase (decarboxylating)
MKSPTKTQVGGGHYVKMAIQPFEYSMLNNLDPLQHTIIKYVTRFRDKNGIEDLDKAQHCIELLKEYEKRKV